MIAGVTRRPRIRDRQQRFTNSHSSPHLHSLSSDIMSEKLKEFVEIPQEFIHDGQQVRPNSRSRRSLC